MGARLAERGIATPECRRVAPAMGLPGDFSYPAVLKPIDGAGSLDTFEILEAAMVPEDAKGMSEALLQPLVPGIPMSASFLVGKAGARLIGVGRQRIQRREGRFVYRGGTLPAARECIDDAPRLAVESVSGLQGFVGVDFIWDEEERRACVLEINPRPTTSYVGLARLLPPGMLAQAWIDAVEGTSNANACDLAEIVHRRAPLTFFADGTIERGRDNAWP
jgi:tyramine---L-glutamate ligase